MNATVFIVTEHHSGQDKIIVGFLQLHTESKFLLRYILNVLNVFSSGITVLHKKDPCMSNDCNIVFVSKHFLGQEEIIVFLF